MQANNRLHILFYRGCSLRKEGTMIKESMKTLEENYNTTLHLRDSIQCILTTLSMCKNSPEIPQKTIDDCKSEIFKIQKKSSNGFLVMEIFELTSRLSNISSVTKAIKVCDEYMEYLNKLLSYFSFCTSA